jgi:DNA-binding response OmpR family regulator
MKKEDLRILVVDDEEELCNILQYNLESEGFLTEVVFTAEDALNKDIKSYNLIILDVMLQGMNGFQFAQKIRKEMKLNIPIVFISAKNSEHDLMTGFKLGGNDYISKPFSVREVITRVKSVLEY